MLKYLITNSKRTKNFIPWDLVETYIKNNLPYLLTNTWESVAKTNERNDKSGLQGYFGYTVLNGQGHYFI